MRHIMFCSLLFVFTMPVFAGECEPSVGVGPGAFSKMETLGGWITYGAKKAQELQAHNCVLSLEIEVVARRELAEFWRARKSESSELTDSYLDTLLQVSDAGFLKEYVSYFILKQKNTNSEAFEKYRIENLSNHIVETNADIKY